MNQRLRNARVAAAWVLLIGSLIGWPLAALTWAKGEPQFILGLSFLAIVLESASLLTSSQVHAEQGEQPQPPAPPAAEPAPAPAKKAPARARKTVIPAAGKDTTTP